jgi:hypothetical protein
MKAITWQVVLLAAIGLFGFIILYLLVPATDPMRGALVTAFNSVIGAVIVLSVNHKQQQVENKVDQVIANGNGHGDAKEEGPAAH